MTYATCKAIAISLFTMAFMLSASSLVLFIDDVPEASVSTDPVVSEAPKVVDLAQVTDTVQLTEPIKDSAMATGIDR
mgnify:CR=1 FL=1